MFMIRLLLFLLISTVAFGQPVSNNERVRDHYYKIIGKPTIIAPTKPAYSIDPITKQVWRSLSTTQSVWTLETDTNVLSTLVGKVGKDGRDGISPTISIGQVLTGAPGTPAIVVDTDSGPNAVWNITIPAGQTGATGPQGPPGPGGSGSSGRTFITPYLCNDLTFILVAAYGQSITVSAAGVNPAVYVGITVTGSDNFDWANLQYAYYLNKQSGKKIEGYGHFKGMAKGIRVEKEQYALSFDGGNTESTSLTFNSGVPYAIDRDDATGAILPNGQIDWKQMISSTRWVMKNFTVNLQGTSRGFDTQMQNGSIFENIVVNQGTLAFECNFTIGCYFNMIKCFSPTGGGISITNGRWPGAGTVETGSVMNTINKFHLISFTTTDFGVKLKYCEATHIIDPIIEGWLVKRGFDIDGGNDPNYKLVIIDNLYCESGGSGGPYTGIGNGQAIIYARMNSGLVVVNGVKGIYPAAMMDIGSQGGRLKANIRDCPWWPHISTPTGNKAIYVENTGVDVSFEITGWANGAFINDYRQMFAGRAIGYGCATDGNAQGTWTVCVR